MKSIWLIVTLIFSLSVWSQKESVELNLTELSDTLFWKKIQTDKINEFDLPRLDKKSDFVFRKWGPGSFLEISKNNDSVSARIIYFVFEVWEDNNKADIFKRQFDLPKKTATSLYDYIINSKIETIPSEKYIEGWSEGFDGITHVYEIKNGTNYSFKNYWTPKIQEGIKEAEYIIKFNERIGEIGNLKQYGEQFSKEVPFPNYMYSGQAYSIMKVMSGKEWRKYKRERKKRTEKPRDNKT